MFKNNKRKSKKILNKFLILSGLFATLNIPLVKAMPNNKDIKQQINSINENKPEPKNNLNNIKKADSKKNEKKIKIYDMEYKNKQNKKSTFNYALEDIENKELPENLKIRNDLTLNVNSNKKYDLNSKISKNFLKYNKFKFKEDEEEQNVFTSNLFEKKEENLEENLIEDIKKLRIENKNYFIKLNSLFKEINTKYNLKIDEENDRVTIDNATVYPSPENGKSRRIFLLKENKTMKEILAEMKRARLNYIETVDKLIKMLDEEKTNRDKNKQNFNNLGYYLLNVNTTKLQKECIDVLKCEKLILENAEYSLKDLSKKDKLTKYEVIKELVKGFATIRNLYLNEDSLTYEQQNAKPVGKKVTFLY